MTALPPALAPWAGELGLLPRDLALGLYPLVARLAAALGELRAHAWDSAAEPDGYEGLARRGPYTRLLASEWLLASELPDEFLRRAAAAEHAFLQLKHAQPAGARRSLLLFDCGPSVLGAPRVVQLALLIVLARRARSAGVELGFGALQDPSAGFCSELSPASLLQLLRARSALPASDGDAAAWLERSGPLQRSDDLWLIGGAELARLAPFERWPRVLLEEPLAAAERTVSARVLRAGRPPVQLQLPLPEPALCVRLLRDPLSAARAPAQRVALRFDPAQPIAFSGDGRRIQVWLQDGAIASLPVPNSPRATPGVPRIFRPRPGERVIGFGSSGRRFFALTQRGASFFSYGCSGARTLSDRVEAWLEGEHGPGPSPEQARGVLYGSGEQRWFLNGRRELFELTPSGSRLRPMPETLSAAPGPDGGLLCIFVEERGFVIGLLSDTRQRQALPYVGSAMPRPAAWIGCHSRLARCLAIAPVHGPSDLTVWPLFAPNQLQPGVSRPSGSTVHGALARGSAPALLLLDASRRTVSLFNQSGELIVAHADSPIAQLAASPASPHLAYLTEHGELVAHSLAQQAVVLHTRSEAP